MRETQDCEPLPKNHPPAVGSENHETATGPTSEPALAGEVAWTLLSIQSDAVVLADRDGRILFVNEAACRREGKPSAELLGATVWGLWPERQRQHVKLVFNHVLRTNTPASFVEGEGDHWSEIQILPICHAGDHAEVAAIQSRDVSQRISAEERLKRLMLQLVSIQEDERRRIAQELHDDIGQQMAALLLGLKAAERAIAAGREEAQTELEHCVRGAEALMRQMRQVLYYLRPPALTRAPLPETLEALCSSFSQDTGLRVDLSCQEALPPVPDAQAVAIYRLVQEGLHNAVKHARATTLWISLDAADGEVAVSIEDNGQGFDPRHAGGGMGLQGIRDRFLLLNGTFEIESAPGEGTRLYGSLPVMPPATEVSS